MNKFKLLIFFIVFFNTITISVPAQNTQIEDFVIYSAVGERRIFSQILSSIPKAGVLMINFTSIYCKPCRIEIPELRELASKYKERVRLICIYSETGKQVQECAEQLGVFDRSFVDPFGKAQALFTVKKVPVTFLIDKKGRIIQRFDGYTQENMKALEIVIKEKKY